MLFKNIMKIVILIITSMLISFSTYAQSNKKNCIGPFCLGQTYEDFMNKFDIEIVRTKREFENTYLKIEAKVQSLQKYLSDRIRSGDFKFYQIELNGPYYLAEISCEYNFPAYGGQSIYEEYSRRYGAKPYEIHLGNAGLMAWHWGGKIDKNYVYFMTETKQYSTNQRYSLIISGSSSKDYDHIVRDNDIMSKWKSFSPREEFEKLIQKHLSKDLD